jgi:glycosylphosphatidylinositol transamidase (GPIT) subunit GPI8
MRLSMKRGFSLKDFKRAYENENSDVFFKFCNKHNITSDECLDILQHLYGVDYINRLMEIIDND